MTTGAAPLVDAAEVTLTDGVVLTQKLLDAGNSATYSYDASACDGFLHVELWDRIRLTPGQIVPSFSQSPRAHEETQRLNSVVGDGDTGRRPFASCTREGLRSHAQHVNYA